MGLWVSLDLPPSTNQNTAYGKHGVYQPQLVKDYKEYVGWIMRSNGIEPTDEKVMLRIDIYPENDKRDIDNFLKVLMDGMEKHVYKNDRQVRKLHVELYDFDPNELPRIEIKASFGGKMPSRK